MRQLRRLPPRSASGDLRCGRTGAGHHPDLDVRYPAWLHVTLTTHAVDAVTNLDVDLAGEITTLAATAGAVSAPRTVQALEVAIDAMDIEAVRPFWKAVLDYEDAPSRPGWDRRGDRRPGAGGTGVLVPADGGALALNATGGSTSTSPSPTTSQSLGSPPHWRPAAHWSAIAPHGPSGSSPIPRATRPASVPGRTAN